MTRRTRGRPIASEPMSDTFTSFAKLAAVCTEGVDYRISGLDRGAAVLVMAPHGGTIEPGTSELAHAVAEPQFNVYEFKGLQRGAFARLHLTSTRFDEPKCLQMLTTAARVVTIHGLARPGKAILVGGLDTPLRKAVVWGLQDAGFDAAEATEGAYAAQDPRNICNRGPSGRGVQLEIERGLRDELRHDHDVLTRLSHSIRSAIWSVL